MINPTVSFIIPCYKLAHFLSECVHSILRQSYCDFEILIMDDCSPDNTSEIANSFADARVTYIRNESNLGHIRNYNKGIHQARGQYIWLISADDRLRTNTILERYVSFMESQPTVGYVFCPGIGLKNGVETGILPSYTYGKDDVVFDGRAFIATVLCKFGGILTPSVMVRRVCYEQVSMFPVEMPHQGDMFLWFMWALHFDVGYMSEPMVNYRDHSGNMMKDFVERIPQTVFDDEVNVLWRTKQAAWAMKYTTLADLLNYFIARKYAQGVEYGLYGEGAVWGMTTEGCRNEIRAKSRDDDECASLTTLFNALLADRHMAHWSSTRAQESLSEAGEYRDRNPIAELLRSEKWSYTERWKRADLQMSAARLFFCQGKLPASVAFAIRAFITRPTIAARLAKPILRALKWDAGAAVVKQNRA